MAVVQTDGLPPNQGRTGNKRFEAVVISEKIPPRDRRGLGVFGIGHAKKTLDREEFPGET
jgi:hypothetical protein